MTETKAMFKLEEAQAVAEQLVEVLAPACERIQIGGSIRRRRPEVGDIELVCIPIIQETPDLFSDPIRRDVLRAAVKILLSAGGFVPRGAFGEKNKYVRHLASGIPVDIFSSDTDNWGMALFVRTGPARWNISAMSRFRQLGRRGHAYGGVTLEDGTEANCPDEETVFKYLGWDHRPPEARV